MDVCVASQRTYLKFSTCKRVVGMVFLYDCRLNSREERFLTQEYAVISESERCYTLFFTSCIRFPGTFPQRVLHLGRYTQIIKQSRKGYNTTVKRFFPVYYHVNSRRKRTNANKVTL